MVYNLLDDLGMVSDHFAPASVVVQSGTPVEMPWAAEAPAILQAFYGGNAVGYGVSDVVFGKVNPSSRLPLTFPVRLEDNPSYLNFGGENGKGAHHWTRFYISLIGLVFPIVYYGTYIGALHQNEALT